MGPRARRGVEGGMGIFPIPTISNTDTYVCYLRSFVARFIYRTSPFFSRMLFLRVGGIIEFRRDPATTRRVGAVSAANVVR